LATRYVIWYVKQYMARLVCAAAATGAILAASVPSFAATTVIQQTVTKTYATKFVKDQGQAIPITGGVLRLTVTKEGFINGYYTPPGTAWFIPVVGGLNGQDLWFDIGNNARATHVTGTLQGGQIAGYASESDGIRYRFTAVQTAAPA
jgi:hypothetical protein